MGVGIGVRMGVEMAGMPKWCGPCGNGRNAQRVRALWKWRGVSGSDGTTKNASKNYACDA